MSKLNEINPENVSFNGGAKTYGCFKIDEPLKNLAASVSCGFPMTVPTAPSNTLAQTPSFRASLGQLCFVGLSLELKI